MEQENFVKNWLTSSVFELSCKNNFKLVLKKILNDDEKSASLAPIFVDINIDEREKVKPVFLFIQVLKQLLSSVKTFSIETATECFPWNSDALSGIVTLLVNTYEQCEYISLRKFFSLLSQLKFLDLMHSLRCNVESSALLQKLNLHFPRWNSSHKASLQKQFSIENMKILDKVEESYAQCRRLILKLATDSSYRSLYMKEQFLVDMRKMMKDSLILLKEVIDNLSLNAGLTAVERILTTEQTPADTDNLGYQLLLDYLQPAVTEEALLQFLSEIEPSLEPPSGGFSSCLLPFDTLSECSDVPMDSECEENNSDSCSEGSSDEKDETFTES